MSFAWLNQWRMSCVLAAGLALGCSLAPPAEKQPASLSVQLLVRSQKGDPVAGAEVQLGSGQFFTDESGRVSLTIPYLENGQTLRAICPASHQGDALQRKIAPSVFKAGAELELSMQCDPITREIWLAVQSDCADVEVYADEQLVGNTTRGLLHARYTRPTAGNLEPLTERPIRLRVFSQNAQCMFYDRATKQASASVEYTAEVDQETLAVWASFQKSAPPQRRYRIKKQKARPYRL